MRKAKQGRGEKRERERERERERNRRREKETEREGYKAIQSEEQEIHGRGGEKNRKKN